jgi:low affinity Fe/Cu permease
MKEKFPITKTVITALYVAAAVILVIGGGAAGRLLSDSYPFSIYTAIGTLVATTIPLFFAELLKIVLEIEKNTRKD